MAMMKIRRSKHQKPLNLGETAAGWRKDQLNMLTLDKCGCCRRIGYRIIRGYTSHFPIEEADSQVIG